MIISFSIENWMSFHEPVTFSMVASRERQHKERVPKIAKYQTRILPIAAIYGGNASGKTNFFKALNFVKTLVVRGTRPNSLIPVEPYLLDSASIDKPSRFKLELLIDEIIYEFSFAVTKKVVVEEKLVKITSTSEKILYDRKRDKLNFYPNLDKDRFLTFVFRGTRDNQLFLTNSVFQKIDTFRPVYDWFDDKLEMITPDTRFGHFFEEDHPLYSDMSEMLQQLDTGISNLGREEIPFKNIPLPEELKSMLQEDVKEGKNIRLLDAPINLIITRKAGELVAKKLVTFHSGSDGTKVKFDIHQESGGSQRLFDLLPAFIGLSVIGANKVYVIDEIDRRLHSLLIRELIEAYLDSCSNKSRSQLLMTTHDVLLMDQDIFRRDEMWVTERNSKGNSDIFSFNDYKDVRYDKDIRKSYLHGRFGGVPKILLNTLTNRRKEESNGG